MGRVAHSLEESSGAGARVFEVNVRGLRMRVADGGCSARAAARRRRYLVLGQRDHRMELRDKYGVMTYILGDGNGVGVEGRSTESDGKL